MRPFRGQHKLKIYIYFASRNVGTFSSTAVEGVFRFLFPGGGSAQLQFGVSYGDRILKQQKF